MGRDLLPGLERLYQLMVCGEYRRELFLIFCFVLFSLVFVFYFLKFLFFIFFSFCFLFSLVFVFDFFVFLIFPFPPQIPGTYDPDDLMDLFDLDRMEGCEVSPTWLACATCGQKPLDLVSCHIPEMPPEAPYCLPIKQVPLWNKCREKIRDYIVSLGKKPPRGWPRCLLAFMFWQIGWDCGVTLRSLHQSGKITWGRFWHDENENEEKVPHFNGHPNSFVVLPPELVEDHLMAPLNFDLAYTEASYESKEKGDAEENFDVELNFLRLVLAGADIRTSAIIPETSSEFRIQMVSIGMRDTLLAGFDCAFAGEKNAHPFVPELKGVIVAMTQVALMLGDLNDKLDPLV